MNHFNRTSLQIGDQNIEFSTKTHFFEEWPCPTCQKYSKKYVSEEILAKQEKKGIWQGKFEMPWDYRKSKKN